MVLGAQTQTRHAVSEGDGHRRRNTRAAVDPQSGEAADAAHAVPTDVAVIPVPVVVVAATGRAGVVDGAAVVTDLGVEAHDAAEARGDDRVLEARGGDVGDGRATGVTASVVTLIAQIQIGDPARVALDVGPGEAVRLRL